MRLLLTKCSLAMKRGLGRIICRKSDLWRVLEAARDFQDPDADDELMPLRTMMRSGHAPMPSSLATEMVRFENRVARDPQRRQRLRATEERMLHVAGTHEDVCAHFKRVTGHSVDDFRDHSADGTKTRRLRDKQSRSERLPLARMRAGSAVLASVLMICVVTLGSYGDDPLAAAIGNAVATESVLFGSLGETTRGHSDPQLEQRRIQVRAALDRIDAARTSVLGFHTGYDPTALEEAADLLMKAAYSGSMVEPAPTELLRLRDEILRLLTSSISQGERAAQERAEGLRP